MRHSVNRVCYFLVGILTVVNALQAWSVEDRAVQYYQLAQPLFTKAEQTGDRQALLASLQFLKSAYEINPKYYAVLNTLAKTYYLLGMFDNAVVYANAAFTLRNDDPSIQVVLVNIAIRTKDFQSVSTLLQSLENQDPYSQGVLYSTILYYMALRNTKKAQEYIMRFRDIYPNNILLNGIFTIVQAITTNRDSDNADAMASKLAIDFPDNIFIAWVLNEYYYTFNRWERTTPFITRLFASEISNFRADAYKRQFDMTIQRDNALAQTISEHFTEAFPSNTDAWFDAGYSFFVQGEYYQAAKYFKKGADINPRSEFLLFMYDVSLKRGGDSLKGSKMQRIDALVAEAQQLIEIGDFSKARSLCRRALFIDTIASEPRLLLGKIFQMQGDVNKALNEFGILENRGITLPNNVEYLRDNNMQQVIDALGVSVTVTDTGQQLMPWRITVEDGTFDGGQRKAPFFKELFLHYLSQFEKIYITNIASPFDDDYFTEAYELQFNVYHSDTQIMVQAEILNTRSQNILFTVSSIGDGDEIMDTIASLAKQINDLFPTVAIPIAIENDSIVLGAGSVSGVLDDTDYSLYDTGMVSLSSESPYYTTEGIALATVHVLDVYDVFSTGQLTLSTETESSTTYRALELQKLLDIQDVIVIPPLSVSNESDANKSAHTFQISSNDMFSKIMNALLLPIW